MHGAPDRLPPCPECGGETAWIHWDGQDGPYRSWGYAPACLNPAHAPVILIGEGRSYSSAPPPPTHHQAALLPEGAELLERVEALHPPSWDAPPGTYTWTGEEEAW